MKTAAKLNSYRNVSFIAFLEDVVTVCEKFDTRALKIAPSVNALNAEISALNSLFGTAKGNLNTEGLERLDEKRDNAMQGIQTLAEAYLKHFNASSVASAKSILAAIAKYGSSISRQSYLDETKTIRSLVADLETDANLVSAIAALNLNAWVAELKASNEAFNTLYHTRNDELAAMPDQKIKDIRVGGINKYRDLVKVVSANDVLTPNTEYATILERIEEFVIKYNNGYGGPKAPVEVPPTV